MAKVTFASLKLKVNTDVKTFNWEDKEIEVGQYLPINDKNDLIAITMQKSKMNDIYNPVLVDMYFHLHIVYMYTNLTFTDKQREDEMKLYDLLQSSGLLNKIIENMNEEEYEDLLNKIEEYIEDDFKYTTTAAGLIKSIIVDLPAQAQAAMDIVNQFDQEKFEAVKNFAEAANGGREIPTTEK